MLNQAPQTANIIIGQKVKGNGTVQKGDGIIADNLVSFFFKQKLVGRTNFFTGLQKEFFGFGSSLTIQQSICAKAAAPAQPGPAPVATGSAGEKAGFFFVPPKSSSFPLAGLTVQLKVIGFVQNSRKGSQRCCFAPKDPIAQAGTGSANLLGQMGFFRREPSFGTNKNADLCCRRTQGLF